MKINKDLTKCELMSGECYQKLVSKGEKSAIKDLQEMRVLNRNRVKSARKETAIKIATYALITGLVLIFCALNDNNLALLGL